MTKAIKFRRVLCLLLAFALLPALLPGQAVRAEGKKPGVLRWESFQNEMVLPDTLPGGYDASHESYELALRDPDEEPADGKKYTTTENVISVKVKRTGGTIPETETKNFFCWEPEWHTICVDFEDIRTEGNAVFELHMESEHYYLDYPYEIQARPYNETEDALPHYEIDFFLEPGETLTSEEAHAALKEKFPGIKHLAFHPYEPESEYGAYRLFDILVWSDKKDYSYERYVTETVYILTDEERYGTDEAVTVKNFAQLKAAVNESNANRIIIAPSYKHGKAAVDDELELRYGRTITVSPADGKDAAVINGGLIVTGNGHLVFDRVDIEAQDNVTGLWVKDGADVTIGSVRGGNAKKGSGGAGACVVNAALKVTHAQGGHSVTGLGGDGILAIGSATVEAGDAVGGASDQGIGGAGAIAAGGAQVTVNGSATGGNGSAAPGQGVLAGQGSTVTAQAPADGEITEAKKKADPEVVSSYAVLQHAIRSGKTDITLDGKFDFGETTLTIPLFTLGDGTVRISAPEGTNLNVKNGFFDLRCGRWEISGIDLNNTSGYITALNCDGNTEAVWNGNLTVKNANAAVVSRDAKLTVNGKIDHSSKDAVAVGAITRGQLEVNGDITEKSDINAVYNDGSTVRITGSVTKTSGKDKPAVYSGNKGMVTLNGSLSSGGSQAVYCDIGNFVQNGDITGKPSKFALIYVYSGRAIINGNIPADAKLAGSWYVINGEYGSYRYE